MYSKNIKNIYIILFIFIFAAMVYLFIFKKSNTTTIKAPIKEKQLPIISPMVIFSKKITLNGEVTRGQYFEKEIENGLFFRLEPSNGLGWTISVGTKTSKISAKDVGYDAYNNFAAVVTPPYRGVNNISIEGWHFRNSDNTGPNLADEKNINAPQEVREFNFVLNDANYQKAFEALQKMMWSGNYPKQEVAQANMIHDKLNKGRGKLTIRDLTLNNLIPGKQAGIESMKFNVEFSFP